MILDHYLCKGLYVRARRLVESHAAELDLRHVLEGDVTHEVVVVLQVRPGSARADCGRFRLRAFRLRAAADDDGSECLTQEPSATHRILPRERGFVPQRIAVQEK